METTVFEIVGSVLQLDPTGGGFKPIAEGLFDSLDLCWAAAQAVNAKAQAVAEGVVAVCWPSPSDALVVTQ